MSATSTSCSKALATTTSSASTSIAAGLYTIGPKLVPLRQGSALLKGTRFGRWFDSLVISSASHGQFHTSLTVGDAIRTTLTPLTFSKPTFNGLQWDFLADKYALTLLGSRLNAPGFTALNEAGGASAIENTTRLLGARGVAQVGDFAKLGLTWVNVSNTSSELSLGDNSLKGLLTGPQNTGNVERVIIRIADDSPESEETGASFFVDQVIIDGELHPEIVPLVRGGVRREGILEVSGSDVIELIYDIRNDFSPTEKVGTFREAKKLEFELVVSNDYRIEIASNLQTNARGEQVFLPVAQARDEITDGSNQTFVRFAYGLPTGHEVIGMDLELINLAHFDSAGRMGPQPPLPSLPQPELPQATRVQGDGRSRVRYGLVPALPLLCIR